MKTFPKSIRIFLIDGDPNGRLTCELSNWTGKAYKIPRNELRKCTDREDLQNTGVYILFGKSTYEEEKNLAYIGEAEEIYKRLLQHLDKKEFWKEAVVFISKDENLNKAHIKYLESRLHEIAIQANRYSLDNSVIPTKPKISEADQAEMEEFIENIKTLINTLGYKIFEELRKPIMSNNKTNEPLIFFVQGPRGADAQGIQTNEGFVVLKGSFIACSVSKSFQINWNNLRNNLINQKILVDVDGKITFSQDYLFSSPSAAAAIVLGRSANGLTEWKTEAGRVLKQVENE